MGVVRTGTVTFLFTDIEDSTRRWADDESVMAAALQSHDAVLTDAIERHGGSVFKHTGDGFAAVFDSAVGAVNAAIDSQNELELPVRMGLHTGEAERRDGDFYGPTLNQCARIMDAGHGGQILVSSATRQLLAGSPHLTVIELGPYRLKGIDELVTIHQVGDVTHPQLRAPRGDIRLPSVANALVGRDDLVSRVVDELDDHRIVTLTGVGGSGKTRVAVEAAAQRSGRHDLVVFVDLGEISDDDEVLPATCRALNIADHRVAALELALVRRAALMVLDNCEHVLDGAVELVEDLSGLPDLRVLATSREGLGIDGERLYAVPGLPADDAAAPAIRMFFDRAEAANAELSLDDVTVETVGEICRRLDGLPLAIELAAARVGVLSPRGLLERLDERFQLLTGGRKRRSRDRQRTLRETIDWSYGLLDDDERDVFELMSVFGGSFDLAAATAIAEGRDEFEVLDLLGALIDKSLLTTVEIEGMHRYRYLETIRGYAEERFDGRTDADAVVDRYHRLMKATVESIAQQLDDAPRPADARLRSEIPNLRKAFDRALDAADPAACTELLAPLAEQLRVVSWGMSGWAEEALALDGAVGSSHEPTLLCFHGFDRFLEGRFDVLPGLIDQLVTTARHHGVATDSVLYTGATNYQLIGDDRRLEQHLGNWLAALPPDREADRRLYIALSQSWRRCEPADASEESAWSVDDDRAVATAASHGRARFRLMAVALQALRARHLRDYATMRRLAEQARSMAVPASVMWFGALQIQSMSAFHMGRLEVAIELCDADLAEAYRVGDRSAAVMPLLVNALVLDALGELEAAATVRGRLPRRLTVMFIRELADLDRRLREQLDPERFDELTATGARMEPRELQDLTHRVAARYLDLREGDEPASVTEHP